MDLSRASVAVTGATGFLGRYLIDVLERRGARVIGVVRNPDRVQGLRDRFELRKADLADFDSLARSFEGVDAVVSNAALLSLRPRGWQTYLATNVEGTSNVYRAMEACGVERAVQISSVGVYREHRPPVDESHPIYDEQTRGNRINAYSLSKALSERAAWRMAKKAGIQLSVLRPSGIYGAFDQTFTAVHKRVMGIMPVTLYPCLMHLCLVHAGDVAEAAALCLENSVSVAKPYNVAGEDRSTWEFASAWKKVGAPSAWFRIPLPVPYRRIYSSARIQQDLGWRSRSYEEGIREILASEAS